MHNISTRAQGMHQSNSYFHAISDRISSYLQNIKESYASFIDRLLWTEVADVRHSSSEIKKDFHITVSPAAVLTKPTSSLRSSDLSLEKRNTINSSVMLEKTASVEGDIDPIFNRDEAIQEEKDRRAELNILTSTPIERLTNKQLQQNKWFVEYYTDSISLNFIRNAWLGSDGKIYDYNTLIHLNGINPITKAPLLAVADQRFLQEHAQYQNTGVAPDILLDPYTNQVMQTPVFTTNGVRCDYTSAKDINPGAILQKDFAAAQLLEAIPSNKPTHNQHIECNSVEDCLTVVDQENCSEQQRKILELAYQQQDALSTHQPRSYVGHSIIETSSILSTGRQFTMADIVQMLEMNIASANRIEVQLQEMKNEISLMKIEIKENQKSLNKRLEVIEKKFTASNAIL